MSRSCAWLAVLFTCASWGAPAPKRATPAIEEPSRSAWPIIEHQPVSTATRGEPLTLTVRIVSPAGRMLFDPTVFVRVGSGSFVRIPLQPHSSVPALYVARLPAELTSDEVSYFIETFDDAGNGPSRKGSPESPLRIKLVAPFEPPPAPAATPPPPPPAQVVEQPAPLRSGVSQRTVGLLVGGGGLLLVAAGGVSGVLALQSYGEGKRASEAGDLAGYDAARSAGQARALAADVLYVGAALALGAGIVLFLTGGGQEQKVAFTLEASPRGASAVVTGRF